MKSIKNVLLLASCLFVLSTGCATTSSPSSESVVFSVNSIEPHPPNHMVAQKIPRPLYLVLDPAKIQDRWAISSNGRHGHVVDFHAFITRDLKRTMSNYFATVEVVSSAAEIPPIPHVIADIQVEKVYVNPRTIGHLTYSIIEMNWGFALRPNESPEYMYSYAAVNQSESVYATFDIGFTQLIEGSIVSMLKGWTEDDGLNKLRIFIDSAAQSQPPTQTDDASYL